MDPLIWLCLTQGVFDAALLVAVAVLWWGFRELSWIVSADICDRTLTG